MTVDEALRVVDEKKRLIDAVRPLPQAGFESLMEALRVEVTYTSNAVEGNHLDLAETAIVLEGITVGGKPLKDHLEAIDHAEAFDYILQLAGKDTPFTETDLRAIHSLVLRRSKPFYAGRYRDVQVWITGSPDVPPPPAMVPGLMADLFKWWAETSPARHPVTAAAEFHARLVAIHPFADGNGRTARLATNLVLLKTGYPIAIVKPEDRQEYFADVMASHQDDYEQITLFFAVRVEQMEDRYLELIRMIREGEEFIGQTIPAKLAKPQEDHNDR